MKTTLVIIFIFILASCAQIEKPRYNLENLSYGDTIKIDTEESMPPGNWGSQMVNHFSIYLKDKSLWADFKCIYPECENDSIKKRIAAFAFKKALSPTDSSAVSTFIEKAQNTKEQDTLRNFQNIYSIRLNDFVLKVCTKKRWYEYQRMTDIVLK